MKDAKTFNIIFTEVTIMNKRIVKKVVSVIACASILAGYASISNAASINSGSS